MDELSTAFPRTESPLSPRARPRKITTSFSSQTSAPPGRQGPARLRTPVSYPHLSPASIISNGSPSEILAPVPVKHHNLAASESSHWLGSPTLSVSSSRPISPMSLGGTSGDPPVLARRRRLSYQLSFSSLMEMELGAHPLRAERTHKSDPERDSGEGMGRRWVRWMHKHGAKRWVVPCAVLMSVWIKWAVGLGSYSGQGAPPMFGDYEAQRHWMELTIHLPVREWYSYDLPYWGLDYPPLTAYVSWLCGIVGSWMDPQWFALDASRGLESATSKVYLRSTVIAFDTLVYVPALLMFTHTWQRSRSARTQEYALSVLLLQPALLLIDFGHFQYNSVMLGLTLLALNCFAIGRDISGAVFFVLSLGFKQMALYYAPAIGSYLFGKCLYLGPAHGIRHFMHLAAVTILTFILLFLPFLPPFAPLSSLLDPVTRIFPFNRGLFEDKVANFWCASDVLVKWRRHLGAQALVRLSAGLTVLGFLPGAVGLMYNAWKLRLQSGPAEENKSEKVEEGGSDARDKATKQPVPIITLLPYALLTSSMSFFLFSFQVHEKTILLPLLPITLLLSVAREGSETAEMSMFVSNIAVFSMWPLLKKDGLGVPYVALTLFWNRLMGYNPFRTRPESLLQYVSLVAHTACLVLHVLELLMSPPARYPDLFPVLNVVLTTPVFVLAWLWSIRRGIEMGWALGGLGSGMKNEVRPKVIEEDAEGAVQNGSSSSVGGIKREAGARAISLGYAQGRRRHFYRSGSISSVLSSASQPGRERESK
ncbi:glycosyltransferase family 57 protein [Laetiporus sulphureus 93-53]|uniref:Alpha-1,3-glucosyltransferase n=1 Tax=Laetiporus sulphureus 93-53 TaxID=1314785 RepID=A0A165FKU0_9APHY|nr:glycosyltransferase family 57 protein [Laetiporus sulphureus 93-53]KZT09122.1 glycosyltransferase family 57 protein [Laetiporus sulphureus 93-53]